MNIFLNKLKQLNVITPQGKINNHCPHIIERENLTSELLSETFFLEGDHIDVKERIICLMNDIKHQFRCLTCTKPVRLKKNKNEYPSFCSAICSSNSLSTKTKLVNTNLKRYGVEHPNKNKNISLKISTGLKNKTKEEKKRSLKKQEETIIKIYGSTDNLIKLSLKKRAETNLIKYGFETASQNENVREKIRNNHYAYTLVKNRNEKVYDINYLKEEHHLNKKSLLQIAIENGVSHSLISSIFTKNDIPVYILNSSFPQHTVVSWLKEEHPDLIIEENYRLKSGKEIDIFLPFHKLGIEVNGLYWHSENIGGKHRFYHLKKQNDARVEGIQLVHIWDYEIQENFELIKSRLQHLLKITKRKIYARKCEVKIIEKKQGDQFLFENHIQKTIHAKYYIGCIFNNELVSVMSFGTSRFSKKYQYELLRFSNLMNTTVIGGASKMFNHFIKEIKPTSIISYSDRRWGSGIVYINLGMKYVGQTSPNYFYFKNKKRYSRIQCQKHKLRDMLESYDSNMSEFENMKNNGYDRVWDCGNDVFVWIREN